MSISSQLAQHFRAVHFGGNWTSVNLRDTLSGVGWKDATRTSPGVNNIAALVYHMNYYVAAVLKVLQGGPLEASDRFSFDLPPVQSEADWNALVEKSLADAEAFAAAVEALPDAQLEAPFLDGTYGTWYRNIAGIVEHTHYHLGQVALLKKGAAGRSEAPASV